MAWCAWPSTRTWCWRSSRWRACRACTPPCRPSDLAGAGADEIDDIITCPGAYSCNLALTKTMNLGEALQETVRAYDDPQVKRLNIKASGCPNSCGHHWIADIGFYGNARKIDGNEVPYYQMLLGGGLRPGRHDALRAGGAVDSGAPGTRGGAARAGSLHREPAARARASAHTCCATRWRHSAR